MKLYIGNLDRSVTKEHLTDAFKPYGALVDVSIVRDRSNNVSKGFGYVEMERREDAEAARAALHAKPFMGRSMDISEAQDRSNHNRRRNSGGRKRF
ncbi:MAG: RNA-binding protein [Bacteroidetes bacterium]|nr:RNA-binding protein [Bacteroidota bacterium]